MGRYPFVASFEVRDYECDLQGIVNNAVYQHYLEHARHLCLKPFGLSFAELTKAGVRLVVVRAELDYKAPLRSSDAFVVGSRIERRSPVRFVFLQEIVRVEKGRETLAVKAVITCAATDGRGKPIVATAIEPLFAGRHDQPTKRP